MTWGVLFVSERDCAIAPMTSCCSDVRVREPSASTVGASIGLATGLSLHAPVARIATPSAIVEYRFILIITRLEGCIDRQEARAARRIRCDILEPAQRLVAEVRDFRIQTSVLRPGLEVPSTQ